MADMSRFQVLKNCGSARSGVYYLKSSLKIQTPSFLCPTSRGVVPHLTPDNVARINHGSGVFVAVEDFMDKVETDVPFLKSDSPNLRDLMALPQADPLVVAARRSTAAYAVQANSDFAMSIYTSEGFKTMPIDTYYKFATRANPDVLLSAADIPNLEKGAPGWNRARKMALRNEEWLKQALQVRGDKTDLFAPMLPGVTRMTQREYLEYLAAQEIDGLSFWSTTHKSSDNPKKQVEPILDIVSSVGMTHLPRFMAVDCDTPQELLRLISDGYDLFQADMATQYSDKGIALDMAFPVPENNEKPLIWGRDLWDTRFETEMEYLSATVESPVKYCRAYIHHLLKAREMSAWVYLQMHNLSVLDQIFTGVRAAINQGTFHRDLARFEQVYGDADSMKRQLQLLFDKNIGPSYTGDPKAKSFRRL